jgi:hypothetical protein
MANLNPDRSGLKKGNTKGVGRKPSEVTKQRLEYLADIQAAKSEKDGRKNLYADALEGLALLIAEGDGPTIRWYFDQLMGTAKTTVEQLVGDTELFVALGKMLPDYFDTEEDCKVFLHDLKSRIGGTA